MISSTLLLLTILNCLCFAQNETTCGFQWITQQIDHFGQTAGTFQQRYSIYDKFYRAGGPILLYEGEEGAVDCANSTIFFTFAQELGGMAVSLEHRYFGQSMPFGNSTVSWTPTNMKYLTLDNVMADAVNFVNMLKANYTSASESKTVVASGSYGGFLAAMFRLNHPETFFGALADAAPLTAMSDNDTDPAKFAWYDWTDRVYRDRSADAYAKAKEAFTVLADTVLAGNVSNLQEDLGLCAPAHANDTAVLNLPVTYSDIWFSAAQYNYNVARPGRLPLAKPLDVFINVTLEASDPLQVLNNTFWSLFGQPGDSFQPCFNLSQGVVPLIAPGLEIIPFAYLSCNYHPQISSIGNGTMFYPHLSSRASYVASCQEQFGLTPPTEQQLRERYHFTHAEIQNSTRIIFSEGQFDPTTAVGPGDLALTSNKCASRRILVTDMAHREDLFLPDPTDKQPVIDIRNTELQIIKEWLEYCE